MMCGRCFDLLGLDGANFCPRCGRYLKVQTHVPTVEELRAFVDAVSLLLPRIREVRGWLDGCRREAIARRQQPSLDLANARLALLSRAERRLREHLLTARRRLSAEIGPTNGYSLS